MTLNSHELIQRYSLGICTEEEVQELERRLHADAALQDEFLRQAEIDAHLRQEAQLGIINEASIVQAAESRSKIWKWLSGVSTLAASILLVAFLIDLPTQQTAMAFPSLGDLAVNVSWKVDNIWVAAGTGDLPTLRRHLRNNVPVDERLYGDLTPLHMSALFNQPEATRVLLSQGADVMKTNKESNTALHMAAFLGNSEVANVLVAAGADPNARNVFGFSSTDLVATAWNENFESCLHELESDLRTKFDLDRIRNERPRILSLLLAADRPEDLVPSVSIFMATISGNSAAVRQHIAAGTDLNTTEDVGGSSALILAAMYGQTEVARILVEAGADLNLQNKSGGTALHQACFYCHPEIVKLLLDAGADTAIANSRNVTPLDSAKLNLDSELIAVYQHVYESLGLALDLESIRKVRPRVAMIMQQHVKRTDGK